MHLQAVFDIAELCSRHGLKDVVLCPGSRSAPLTLGFARHPDIQTMVIPDERSAGFIALGIAQQTGRPVAIVCTSGSAAYNFAPAVAESWFQQIPLVIFTADRPTEWVGQRDGQTIYQQEIFGRHVKASFHLPEDTNHHDARWHFFRCANEALNVCRLAPKGPVHLNVPLREPLYPSDQDIFQFSKDIPLALLHDADHQPTTGLADQWKRLLAASSKVLCVVGQDEGQSDFLAALNQWSKVHAIPVVGDITSNIHTLENGLPLADTFLIANERLSNAEWQPEILITFGKASLSKLLKQFVRKAKPATHWHVEEGAMNIVDPFQSVTNVLRCSPNVFLRQTTAGSAPARSNDYLEGWRKLNDVARQLSHEFFQQHGDSEFGWVNHVLRSLPHNVSVHLANSLSVRYANWIGLYPNQMARVYCNRGTSGIDGCTSTAVGYAIYSPDLVLLITGDLAFFYDQNAFWNQYSPRNLRILLLNNHGGAIFGVIDGPGNLPEVTDFFVTKQSRNARRLAEEYNIAYRQIDSAITASEREKVLNEFWLPSEGPRLLEIQSDARQAKEVFLSFKNTIKLSI